MSPCETGLTHNKDMAADYLAILDPIATKFTFQFFSDIKDDNAKRGDAKVIHGTLEDAWPTILAVNTTSRGVGVFVTINETNFKGRKASNIVRARAFFLDADSADQVRSCRNAIRASRILPSMVVQSSPEHAHFYFCSDDLTLEQFSLYQAALIEQIGTDPSAKDLPRVMRLPGTFHLKDVTAPKLVTLKKHPLSFQHFKASQLIASFGLSPAPPKHKRLSFDDVLPQADAVRLQKLFNLTDLSAANDLGAGIETDVERIRSAVLAIPISEFSTELKWVTLARGLAREARLYRARSEELWLILDEASKRAPGYNEANNRARWLRYIDEALNHAKPITIATIFGLARKHGWTGFVAPAAEAHGWLDPLPLTAKTAPWPYPLDALPETIRAAVIEVQAFTKAPIAMVASSALAAVSLAMQAHVDVRRAEKLQGPVSLFLLTIADSGERKSTCDGFFTKAIRDYEARQAEAAKPQLGDFDSAKAAWTAREEGITQKIKLLAKNGKPTQLLEAELRLLQKQKPVPPRFPKMLRGDETPENLAWVLSQEWPSAGVLSSEGGLVLGSHGMGKESVMRNLAQLNALWDGGTLLIGRRTSQSFAVRGARLTMALQVQEATLRSFFDRSDGLARGSGFLARFLIARPESTQGSRLFTEPPENWPALAAFNRRITAILDQPTSMTIDGTLDPPVLSLAPDAKAAWVDFHDAVERDLAAGGTLFNVRDFASKSADNAARLAALFQMFEHGVGGAIGLAALNGAGRIARWHLNESRRFFGERTLSLELENATRLDAWLLAYCKREGLSAIPPYKIQQLGPNDLRDRNVLESTIRVLEGLHRARMAVRGRNRVVEVNPVLIGTASQGDGE